MSEFNRRLESAAEMASAKLSAPCVALHEPDIAGVTLRCTIVHSDEDKRPDRFTFTLAEAANWPTSFPLLFRKTYSYSAVQAVTPEQLAEDFDKHVREQIDTSIDIMLDWKRRA